MESQNLCFHCKKTLRSNTDDPTPQIRIGFRDVCPHCHSDAHVCLNCAFYDEGSHHECRESSAEWVKNKDKANVCEYFRLATSSSSAAQKVDALSALDALFKK